MRKKIHDMLASPKEDSLASKIYDDLMLFVIVMSVIPLGFKVVPPFWFFVDKISAVIFCVDYLLRWFTSDLKHPKYQKMAFLVYPFTPFALIDLAPLFHLLHH